MKSLGPQTILMPAPLASLRNRVVYQRRDEFFIRHPFLPGWHEVREVKVSPGWDVETGIYYAFPGSWGWPIAPGGEA